MQHRCVCSMLWANAFFQPERCQGNESTACHIRNPHHSEHRHWLAVKTTNSKLSRWATSNRERAPDAGEWARQQRWVRVLLRCGKNIHRARQFTQALEKNALRTWTYIANERIRQLHMRKKLASPYRNWLCERTASFQSQNEQEQEQAGECATEQTLAQVVQRAAKTYTRHVKIHRPLKKRRSDMNTEF